MKHMGAKEWIAIGALVVGMLGTYLAGRDDAVSRAAVLDERFSALVDRVAANETLRTDVQELVIQVRILVDRQSRPPGGAAEPPPPRPPAPDVVEPEAPDVDEPPDEDLRRDVEDLTHRLRRMNEEAER